MEKRSGISFRFLGAFLNLLFLHKIFELIATHDLFFTLPTISLLFSAPIAIINLSERIYLALRRNFSVLNLTE